MLTLLLFACSTAPAPEPEPAQMPPPPAVVAAPVETPPDPVPEPEPKELTPEEVERRKAELIEAVNNVTLIGGGYRGPAPGESGLVEDLFRDGEAEVVEPVEAD